MVKWTEYNYEIQCLWVQSLPQPLTRRVEVGRKSPLGDRAEYKQEGKDGK